MAQKYTFFDMQNHFVDFFQKNIFSTWNYLYLFDF